MGSWCPSTRRTDVTTSHVLQLLLSAARLYVTSRHASRQLGPSAASKAPRRLPSNMDPAGPAAPESPDVAEIWTRLLENPAVRNPSQALPVLQDILEEGLLDSILPYFMSALDISTTPPDSPRENNTPPKVVSSSTPSAIATKSSPSSVALLPPLKVASKATEAVDKADSFRACRAEGVGATSSEIRKILHSAIRSRPSTPRQRREGVVKPTEQRSEPDGADAAEGPEADALTDSPCRGTQRGHTASTPSASLTSVLDTSPIIVIHVCDEAHGLRQDFSCSRDLLVRHIGYFADLTEGQRLEDVDISVHCDVSVFEWLLRWVKAGSCTEHDRPQLEAKNAVSMLISADFLKMAPLVTEVLQFMHAHAQDVVAAQTNLSCLPDHLLSRLSRQFNQWEVEALQDPKDRLQGRLYARLLQALCDAFPSPARGIFRTAANLYRCLDCSKYITRLVERMVECVPHNTHVTPTGSVYYTHTRDPSWSLTDHVRDLKASLRSWRLVYWRLWGQVHFLPCSTCGAVFAGYELRCCRKHKLEASFSEGGELSGLGGRGGDQYPCCGARALRFSPLSLRNGCVTREHTVQLVRRPEEVWGALHSIYDDLLTYQVLICPNTPPTLPKQQGAYWQGVPLVPSRADRSFLDRSCFLTRQVAASGPPDRSTSTGTTGTAPNSGSTAKAFSSQQADDTSLRTTEADDGGSNAGAAFAAEDPLESSDEEDGGHVRALPPKVKASLQRRVTRAKRALAFQVVSAPSWRWDASRSARHNQDTQREREAQLMKELTAWLSLTRSPDSASVKPTAAPNANAVPLTTSTATDAGRTGAGGTFGSSKFDPKKKEPPAISPGIYYKMEAEFKQRHSSHHSSTHGTFRAKVQAISRIKMRLRNRAAFSANR